MVTCMTDDVAEKLYGSAPLFIFDPGNRSNAPVRNLQISVIERWAFMPQYLKDKFVTAFSQEALKNPGKRLRELDWLQVLVRFRSDIVRCTCGNEVFIQNAATTKCDVCGKPVAVTHTIKLPGYSITAAGGSRVYRCMLGTCNADEALNPVVSVVTRKDKPGMMGVRNMSGRILNATTPSGKPKQIKPNEVIPFIPGIVIEAFEKKIELK